MPRTTHFLAVTDTGRVYRGTDKDSLDAELVACLWFTPSQRASRVAWKDSQGYHVGTPTEALNAGAEELFRATEAGHQISSGPFFLGRL